MTDFGNIIDDNSSTSSRTPSYKHRADSSCAGSFLLNTDGDEMLPAAVDVFLDTNQATVSMLQRRLKLGYARAARIVDEMEEKGIVGPFAGSKPRAILITKEQWAQMRAEMTAIYGQEHLDSQISDELFSKAVDLVLATKLPSATMFKRCLKLDQETADKLIDRLRFEGIIHTDPETGESTVLASPSQMENTVSNTAELPDLTSDCSSSNPSFTPHVSPRIKSNRKYQLASILKEDDTPRPRWVKILSGFAFLCGVASILGSFVSSELTNVDRAVFLFLGVFLCIISTVSIVRWMLISLTALLTGIISLPLVYTKTTGFDLAGFLTVALCFIVSAVYWKKSRKRFVAKQIKGSSQRTMAEIDCMTGLEFEEYTALLLTRLGYSNVTITKASGDQGIDVLAQKNGISYAIQCKNYSSKLGNTPVQEAYAGKAFYDCDVAVVITNSTFTPGAHELASSIGVLLWDRDILQSMIYDAR